MRGVSMVDFTPQFTGSIEGYTKNFINANLWKVDKLYDYDDILQEAREQFLRTIQRMKANGDTIQNEKHMMSLYKTSFSRHFITLCNRTTKMSVEQNMSGFTTDDDTLDFESLIGSDENTGYLECLVDQAPKEVEQVFNLLFNTPVEVLNIAINAWNGQNKKGAGVGNCFLCKMLGYDSSKVNLVAKVKNYLLH